MTETAKLTIRLKRDTIRFAKRYSRDHGLSVTRLIEGYFTRLRQSQSPRHHPELDRFSGILPAHLDAREEYAEGIVDKHGQ